MQNESNDVMEEVIDRMKIRVYGSNDDLVEFENVIFAVDETLDPNDYDDLSVMGKDCTAEYNAECYERPVEFVISDKMILTAHYTRNGTWDFGFGMIREGVPLPDWPITISTAPDNNYSVQVEIDNVPYNDATVRRIK